MSYLRVRNLERYQHYKDRRPVWIKFYVELLDDYELRRLDYATRLFANLALLLAAKHNNSVPNDPKWLSDQTGIEVEDVEKAVASLLSERFLVLAKRKQQSSGLISLARGPRARGEAETETERAGSRSTSREERPPKPPAQNSRTELNGHGNLDSDSMGHALRLVQTIRDDHKDDGTLHVVTSYAGKLPPAAFEAVREQLLERRSEIRNDSKYAVAELKRMVDEGQYAKKSGAA